MLKTGQTNKFFRDMHRESSTILPNISLVSKKRLSKARNEVELPGGYQNPQRHKKEDKCIIRLPPKALEPDAEFPQNAMTISEFEEGRSVTILNG